MMAVNHPAETEAPASGMEESISPSMLATSTFLHSPMANLRMPAEKSSNVVCRSASSNSISAYCTIGPAMSCGKHDT